MKSSNKKDALADDFWIGDRVRDVKSGREGIYHKDLDNKQAQIKIGETTITVAKADLEVIEEEKPTITERLGEDKKSNNQKDKLRLPDQIDLHAAVLDPHHQIPAVRLLEFQVSSCKSYLQQAYQQKKRIVTIIHGKGQGVLKDALLHLYHELGFIRFQIEKHKGGATELWLDV